MAKRGYKLQEFVAHSDGVNCLSIGKKGCRLFVTGGEDHRVNLWAIGKPTSLMSLSGHTTPVESVVFNSAETLVLGGAASGAIKLWDLEEAKTVRTLTGHRSNCTAVEFHPFGEFFASGSLDTNLRIWDIRKKGCIHTYRGHTGGINCIRFTPDGRWVVSGGFDNTVKVWDLTAGKLLHDFKFHEGHIRSIDFHPVEFLLATGSADRTVKFWDLETFELIGSSRPEATGVRSITFHPDGKTLLCGLDDGLKVYSWEPVICHEAFDMGWSTLGDLCVHEGKLLGCSYYRNSVGVWVADVSAEPYGVGLTPEQTSSSRLKERNASERVGSAAKSNGSLSPEHETIKNIYVDSAGEKPIASQRVGSHNLSKVVLPSESKEISAKPMQKRSPTVSTPAKSSAQVHRSFIVPTVVPRDKSDDRTMNTRRESLRMVRADSGVSPKPHIRRPSKIKYDRENLSASIEPGSFCKLASDLDRMDLKLQNRLSVEDEAKGSFEQMHLNSKSDSEKFDRTPLPETTPYQESCNESLGCSNLRSPVKVVNGVAVVSGRTRSLVERFEQRESTEDLAAARTILMSRVQPEPQTSEAEPRSSVDVDFTEDLIQSHDEVLCTLRSRLTKLQVLRHYWERSDIKASLVAMRKLRDYSVQADVITALMEKIEVFTLDLFSCLLPVLTSLLDSKVERHANVSLEMLLKLVAVFGPVVRSTVSAPRVVGVDLHAEQRFECCKQCSDELQKVQRIIPAFIKRDGVLAKLAQELSLILQES